jgi:uncharacterized protein YndB with AHSA1/START domain
VSANDELGTIVDGRAVRFERLLPVPLARAWWFLSEPEGMAGWLTDADMEPRAGGRLELRWEDGEVQRGEVLLWEPERALEYTWSVKDEESLVRYELAPEDGRTRLVVTHSRLAANRLAGYAAGWDAHLVMLVAACEGGRREFKETFDRVLPIYRERAAEAARS